jgi:hypothetical protein
MAVRCDAKGDCEDRSDEVNCKTVVTSVGYNRYNVPPPLGTDDKLKLSFTMDLRKIVEINEKQGTFTVKLRYVRSWTDKQLKYQNLKIDMDNKINPEDVKKMWKPWTIFENIKAEDSYTMTDLPDAMLVKTDGKFDVHLLGEFDNTYIFEGSDNALYYVREHLVQWMCDFDMRWYPFDTQSCIMQFKHLEDSIEFVPGNFTYNGPMDLPEHHVRTVVLNRGVWGGTKFSKIERGLPQVLHIPEILGQNGTAFAK